MDTCEIIEINGIKYKKKPQKPIRPMSPMMMSLMLMAEMSYSPYMGVSQSKKENHSGINIVEEYGLIQQKKSKLSRKEREWVVYKFERDFAPVL
jgi:hypothetical protein